MCVAEQLPRRCHGEPYEVVWGWKHHGRMDSVAAGCHLLPPLASNPWTSCSRQRPAMTFQKLSIIWWSCRLSTEDNARHFVSCTIWSCWSSPRFPKTSSNQTPVHAIEIQCEICTRRFSSIRQWDAWSHRGETPITHSLIPFKKDNTASLISRGEVIAGMVKLDRRNNVGFIMEADDSVSKIRTNSMTNEDLLQPQIWSCGEGFHDIVVRIGSLPSVMSSTSPLSPKHLSGYQLERSIHSSLLLSQLGWDERPVVENEPYCVNFHVGVPVSTSGIFWTPPQIGPLQTTSGAPGRPLKLSMEV